LVEASALTVLGCAISRTRRADRTLFDAARYSAENSAGGILPVRRRVLVGRAIDRRRVVLLRIGRGSAVGTLARHERGGQRAGGADETAKLSVAHAVLLLVAFERVGPEGITE
jgi:hypothetical protein